MRPVTDPAILAALEANEPQEVSDPAILAQLESPDPVQPQANEFINTMMTPTIGAAAAGGSSILAFYDALMERMNGGKGVRQLANEVAASSAADVGAGLTGVAQSVAGNAEQADIPGYRQAIHDSIIENLPGAGPMGPEGVQVAQDVASAIPQGVKDYGESVQNTINEYGDEAYTAASDAGMPGAAVIGAAVKTLPTAAAIGAGFVAPRAGKAIAGAVKKAIPHKMGGTPSAKNAALESLIRSGSDDVATAGKRMVPPRQTRGFDGEPTGVAWADKGREIVTTPGGAQGVKGAGVVSDPKQLAVIKQGIPEGSVASIASSSPASKAKMLKMLDTFEKAIASKRYSTSNRPSDVVGDALLTRYKIVSQANQSAAKRLRSVAKTLQGKKVDPSAALQSFVDDMGELGVKFNHIDRQPGSPLYTISPDSPIKGLKGLETTIKRMAEKMTDVNASDAYALHGFKKYIDFGVNYAKQKKGLPGELEYVFKQFRHNIDELLDSKFDAYNKVNTQYAETRAVIDALQDIAGKRIPLSGESAGDALGTLMRRITSNAQTRVPLREAATAIDAMARKYYSGKSLVPAGSKARPPGDMGDSFVDLLNFADDLDARFGPGASTSFQGQIGQVVKRAAREATSLRSTGEKVANVTADVADQLRGVNDKAALKALRELLK